jgi:multiple sugar transport system permease protein
MRAALREGRLLLIGAAILVWTLLPIYNLVALSFTPRKDAMGAIWPSQPTVENYRVVLTEGHYFLNHFWIQIGNSIFCALATCFLVLVIASCGSYAISRLRLRGGDWVANSALFSYLIPHSFLAIPIYAVMNKYGLLDTRTALILATVAFAVPYAMWVLIQHSESLPYELDEAAKVDGATPVQIFYLIYLPLMVPALIAIGTQAIVMSWNEYLLALLLLAHAERATLPLAIGYFLGIDDPPWPLVMALSMLYALPPIALYFAARRYMVSGLLSGAVKH